MTSFPSTRNSPVGGVFDLEVLEERPGITTFSVNGKKAAEVFKDEAGSHRWQRVPPTEKKGRVQTSTITVAVLPVPTHSEVRLNDSDLKWTACRGSGAGGQNRNVTANAVQLWHLPSGLQVRCESERSQHQNLENAKDMLRAKLQDAKSSKACTDRRENRRDQIGTGIRADKRRTIRVKDGTVQYHVTGKSWDYKKYRRGDW